VAPTQPTAVRPAASTPKAPGAPQRTSDATTTPTETVAAVQPEAVQPGAIKPGAAKAARATKKAPSSRVINPGDKVCGQCGEGNDPNRKFCRRCGASLLEAEVFSLPWYKRLWRRLSNRKQRQAGDRPRQRRRLVGGHGGGWLMTWAKRIFVVALVVFIFLATVGPYSHTIKHHVSTWYHDVKKQIDPTYTPVHPTTALATSSASGHPAGNVIDGASNTSWEANNAGPGQSVIVYLAKPTEIGKFGFLSGDQDAAATSYITQPRPEQITVTWHGQKSKQVKTQVVALQDVSTFQTFTPNFSGNIHSITFTVNTVYPATNSKALGVAIAEIELFTKT
jgi:hypothetical protein